MSEYDSTADIEAHIERVQFLIWEFVKLMVFRSIEHDLSKLGPEEKPFNDRMTPMMKGMTYGSPEYMAALKEIRPAIEHHYRVNSHHPEHHADGVAGMDLMDLCEMFFDWKAASERNSSGSILRSIEVNEKRYALDPQIVAIFRNTAERMGWLTA